jgi:dihydropyrimidinase
MAKKGSGGSLLIRGGTVVAPSGPLEADLLIRGELVQAIGQDLPAGNAEVLDANGCIVLPGVIDAHTHIALDTGIYQTSDDWFTATRAAAFGGVTTVIDFATQGKGQSLRQAVEERLAEAKEATIDYGLHVMVTDLPPGREAELEDLVEMGAPSIKLYTTYRPNYYADDATILRLFRACSALAIRPLVHCENDDLIAAETEALVATGQTGWRNHGRSRPPLAEQEAVQRILLLAEMAGCPVHIVHCTTAQSVDFIVSAQAEGQIVSCETCPQYLLLDEECYERADPWQYVLQPPLRDGWDAVALGMSLQIGDIDLVATDHCDYTRDQKMAYDDFTKTPGGLPGLETLLPLMYTYGVAEERVSLLRLAQVLCTNPAAVWGLWPLKGALLPGFDADVVIYDPRTQSRIEAQRLHHVAGYTPYEGMPVQGEVKATILRGQVVYIDGEFVGSRGAGRFVPRRLPTVGAPGTAR